MSEFTTSKKDIKKGISRIPLEMARIKQEEVKDPGDLFDFLMSEDLDPVNF